jgi:hypothetical protein
MFHFEISRERIIAKKNPIAINIPILSCGKIFLIQAKTGIIISHINKDLITKSINCSVVYPNIF